MPSISTVCCIPTSRSSVSGVTVSCWASAALKRLDDEHAELKSMHVVEAARRGGIGRAMVEPSDRGGAHRGFSRLSLETGSMTEYAPARALYARAGFTSCDPFGDYRPSPNSTFMTLLLVSMRPARLPVSVSSEPTDTQEPTVVQLTEDSEKKMAPAGAGARLDLHFLPCNGSEVSCRWSVRRCCRETRGRNPRRHRPRRRAAEPRDRLTTSRLWPATVPLSIRPGPVVQGWR